MKYFSFHFRQKNNKFGLCLQNLQNLLDLKLLDVSSIAADDCLLFMWTTGPQLANSIKLGESWGFEYKIVAFVWDKMVYNPGRYTLSQTEFVLAFKKKVNFQLQEELEM